MLNVSIIDPQSGEVIQPVPPVFGASAEDEEFFESQAPSFATCQSAEFAALLYEPDQDTHNRAEAIMSCIVRAARNPDHMTGLAIGRAMVTLARRDPALNLDADVMRPAMDRWGVPVEFVNSILTPAAPAVAYVEKKSKLLWIIGGIAAASAITVGVIVYTRKKG